MIKNILIVSICLVGFTNCLSRNALRLKEEPLPQFQNDFSIISVKLNNFKPSNANIELYIQDIDSFNKNGNVFTPTFYYKDDFKSDTIEFSAPKGKYIGFLFLRSKDSIPYYRSIIGFHKVNFGINDEYKRTTEFSNLCVQNTINGIKLQKKTQCNLLEINKERISFEFTLDNKNEINFGSTFLLLWFSASYAFLQGPHQYPYALFLVAQGIAGVTIHDILINFDNHQDF
ncbi:hypothetical protein ACO2KH_12920 [Leptospira terpstrae]|uniref:hypothetical protein n=1 Tax=Leptospira terpstrae TaxID=293075 RepID=UPI003D092AA2